ncbi:MAG: carbamoyltransferase HypF, partial [Eggerthellaceae bacterium]|nr:carbamoyltransferase HypF [Eggerthellaceae bacterium]
FKGLGGFHLVCDAENEEALEELRRRKKRYFKAFACMFADIESIKDFCHVSNDEAELLDSCEKPIVLLKKNNNRSLARCVSLGLSEIGCMLPYSPAHSMLLHDFIEAGGAALVMTSGNFYEDPIVIDDALATEMFVGLADAVIGNNRKIVTRYDDSVSRVLNFGDGQTAIQFIRRARGYAPDPLKLETNKQILAWGAEQKNSFAFAQFERCFVSQHIGDIKDSETLLFFNDTRTKYEELFSLKPELYVADLHPEYLISKEAKASADAMALPLELVQHHHAHIASVLGENSLEGPAIGFAFDGTGFGADGCIWGGEVLLANMRDFERFANLVYFPMPGGEACIKDPLRMAYSVLYSCNLQDDTTSSKIFECANLDCSAIDSMIEQSQNTSYSSSMGRLFDAVSALVGISRESNYEGEPAIMLEAACIGLETDEAYKFSLVKNTATKQSTAQDTSVFLIDYKKVLEQILEDIRGGIGSAIIAAKFHNAVAEMVLQAALIANHAYGIKLIALSGGCFMNRRLSEAVVSKLSDTGFDVALNSELSPNDANISFGQAVVASKRLKER